MKIIKRKAVALQEIIKRKRGDVHGWSAAWLAVDCETKQLFWIHKYNAYCSVRKNEIFIYDTNVYPHCAHFSARKATSVFVLPRVTIYKRSTRIVQYINRELHKFSRPIYYRTDKLLNKLDEEYFANIRKLSDAKNESDITAFEDRQMWIEKWRHRILKYRDNTITYARESLYAIYDIEPRVYDSFHLK